MTAVDYTSIETNSYANILSVIDTRSYIADPRNPDGVKRRKFVYDYDPFSLAINFNELPYIIVDLPETEYPGNASLDASHKKIEVRHRITVRTVRGGSGNTLTDAGRTDMNAICDDLHQTFNSRTVMELLHGYKMTNVKLTKISYDSTTVDMKYVYETVFELSYRLPFLKVTA